MRKDEFSDNAKALGKKGDETKSSTGSASRVSPPAMGPRLPAPHPSFAGPMPIAVNIKPLLPVSNPVKESAVSEPEKDE